MTDFEVWAALLQQQQQQIDRAEKVCRIASKYKFYNEVDDALAEWRG